MARGAHHRSPPVQLHPAPCLLQRFSTTRLLRGSTLLLVPIVLLMPNVSLAPAALRWPLFVVLISASKALAGAFFTCSFMLINNSVPVSTIRPVRGVLCRPPISWAEHPPQLFANPTERNNPSAS